MADDADDALEIEQPETPETEEQEQPEAPEGGDEGEEVVFGDEAVAPAEGESAVIRHLREELKKARQQAASAPPPQAIDVGPKPTLEGCEFDGDKFEAELDAWKDREAQAKAQQAKAGETDQQFQQEWQRDHQSYAAKRAGLKFADVDEVEGVATSVLSAPQQVTIVQACKNPALVLYALGKHPGKLAEVAPITNPIKFAVAVAEMERTLTVKPRTKAPNPEEIPSGTASITHSGGAAAKQLAQMEAAWAKRGGGDRSAIIAFKAQHKL